MSRRTGSVPIGTAAVPSDFGKWYDTRFHVPTSGEVDCASAEHTPVSKRTQTARSPRIMTKLPPINRNYSVSWPCESAKTSGIGAKRKFTQRRSWFLSSQLVLTLERAAFGLTQSQGPPLTALPSRKPQTRSTSPHH